MSIVIACPTCQSKIKAPDKVAGKKVKCPQCKKSFMAEPIGKGSFAGEALPTAESASVFDFDAPEPPKAAPAKAPPAAAPEPDEGNAFSGFEAPTPALVQAVSKAKKTDPKPKAESKSKPAAPAEKSEEEGLAFDLDSPSLELAVDEPAPVLKPKRKPEPSGAVAFLLFQQMITPILIMIFFYLSALGAIIGGLALTILGATQGQLLSVPIGLATLFLGPLVARVYCEVLILMFRIHDLLADIKRQSSSS